MTRQERPIAVLGPGSWGATLAWLYASENRLSVRLWGRDPEKIRQIEKSGCLDQPLPVRIPPLLELETDLERALSGVSLVILACTARSMRELMNRVAAILAREEEPPIMISVVKGLESETLMRMSEVIEAEMPNSKVCSLSGPNLSYEIRSQLPCAAVVAGKDQQTAIEVQTILNNRKIRLYTTSDIVGVELGGAVKNVIAIAAGASDGLELGVNAKAAILTRGLKEMTRLAVSLGARESTMFGLSGMGDVFATCQGMLSRNYRVGHYLARGKTLEEALTMVGAVAEGVYTTRVSCDLASRNGLQLPIASQVLSVLDGRTSCQESIMALMSRPLSAE